MIVTGLELNIKYKIENITQEDLRMKKENELLMFNNKEFGAIRTIEVNGIVMFVANDVAKALGYTNPSKATNDHCKKSEMVWGNDSLGRRQEFKVIPKGDIYRLIVSSKLPSAEKFESWVFVSVGFSMIL